MSTGSATKTEDAMNALVAIALSSMIAAHEPKADDPKMAQAAFQGEWKLTTWAKLGRDFPKDKLDEQSHR